MSFLATNHISNNKISFTLIYELSLFVSKSIFSGLRSLWTIFREWQYVTAERIYRMYSDALFSSNPFKSLILLNNSPPDKNLFIQNNNIQGKSLSSF